jgi:hypothetical protein
MRLGDPQIGKLLKIYPVHARDYASLSLRFSLSKARYSITLGALVNGLAPQSPV